MDMRCQRTTAEMTRLKAIVDGYGSDPDFCTDSEFAQLYTTATPEELEFDSDSDADEDDMVLDD